MVRFYEVHKWVDGKSQGKRFSKDEYDKAEKYAERISKSRNRVEINHYTKSGAIPRRVKSYN